MAGQPTLPAGRPSPPVSASATTALVLAILGTMCLGPIGGVAAVLLGILALREIRQSEGTKGGTVVASIAIGIGGLSVLSVVAILAFFVAMGARGVSTLASPSVPTIGRSPPPTAGPTGTPPRTSSAREIESRDTTTGEVRVGTLTIVDIGSDVTSLDAELRAQRAKAARANEKMVLEVAAASCRPCLGVASALVDPKMQKALAGVRLVRVDTAEFVRELNTLGIAHDAIPAFFLLGADLSPTDGINGGEWDDDTAENVAPVLAAFVRGSLHSRRELWKGQKGIAHPGETSL